MKRHPVVKIKKRSVRGGDDEMNIDEIRELILLLDQTSISDLELEKEGYRISLRKANSEIPAPVNNSKGKVGGTKALDEKEAKITSETAIEVLSPMVGTFYSAASPDSEPYIKIGDHVEAGQTLCILEAMKLFNEIKSDFAGTIVDILAENAEPIEFGQTLFIIEKD